MNNADFIPQLTEYQDAFGTSARFDFQDLLGVFSGESVAEADEACRRIASGQELPPLSPMAKLEVMLRLACAIQQCTRCPDYEMDDDQTAEIALDSLLIDFWRDVGLRSYMGELFGAADWHHPS